MAAELDAVPIVDLAPLVGGSSDRRIAARAIDRACRGSGFFYVVGHGVDEALATRLDALCRFFFAQDLDRKMEIRMEKAGRAWRGYFPTFGELTSGKPDLKEGIYFGAEHDDAHPRVRAGVPLHGKNLFPDLPGFREAVLAWMAEMTRLGHVILEGMALGLGLPASYFAEHLTADPTVLFRAFHYPAPEETFDGWGVGEHTDYGLLTILRQDDCGGLQVKSGGRWIEAPPVPGSFVCNIGDMLDRMTGGLYRSTPHRVHNRSGRDRLSLPFFFDPGWDAEIKAIDTRGADGRADERWDHQNVHAFQGTYGQWLLAKVARVFPELGQAAGVS
jgi:isopenicillin N synthase-like dioxygenase